MSEFCRVFADLLQLWTSWDKDNQDRGHNIASYSDRRKRCFAADTAWIRAMLVLSKGLFHFGSDIKAIPVRAIYNEQICGVCFHRQFVSEAPLCIDLRSNPCPLNFNLEGSNKFDLQRLFITNSFSRLWCFPFAQLWWWVLLHILVKARVNWVVGRLVMFDLNAILYLVGIGDTSQDLQAYLRLLLMTRWKLLQRHLLRW